MHVMEQWCYIIHVDLENIAFRAEHAVFSSSTS